MFKSDVEFCICKGDMLYFYFSSRYEIATRNADHAAARTAIHVTETFIMFSQRIEFNERLAILRVLESSESVSIISPRKNQLLSKTAWAIDGIVSP